MKKKKATPKSSPKDNRCNHTANSQAHKYMPIGVFILNKSGEGVHLGLTEGWDESIAIAADKLCSWFHDSNRESVIAKFNTFRPRFESGEVLATLVSVVDPNGEHLLGVHRRVVSADIERESVIGICDGLVMGKDGWNDVEPRLKRAGMGASGKRVKAIAKRISSSLSAKKDG